MDTEEEVDFDESDSQELDFSYDQFDEHMSPYR